MTSMEAMWESELADVRRRKAEMEKELSDVRRRKDAAVEREDFDLAAVLAQCEKDLRARLAFALQRVAGTPHALESEERVGDAKQQFERQVTEPIRRAPVSDSAKLEQFLSPSDGLYVAFCARDVCAELLPSDVDGNDGAFLTVHPIFGSRWELDALAALIKYPTSVAKFADASKDLSDGYEISDLRDACHETLKFSSQHKEALAVEKILLDDSLPLGIAAQRTQGLESVMRDVGVMSKRTASDPDALSFAIGPRPPQFSLEMDCGRLERFVVACRAGPTPVQRVEDLRKHMSEYASML